MLLTLFAGNGFVLEAVKTVLRVYDAATGSPLLSPVDFNTFFNYPAELDRATLKFGPGVEGPQCQYDDSSRRWFVTSLGVERNPDTSDATGLAWLNVAVSNTQDPRGVPHRQWRQPSDMLVSAYKHSHTFVPE
jgi:hypothetical protein